MRRRLVFALVSAVVAAATLALSAFVLRGDATANQCANACYAAHNQCRVATKGSPSCDSQLSACLARCGRQ